MLVSDGSQPGAGAILLRTIGRVIDVLPLLYLTGLIALLASKPPRRRIGNTIVVEAE